MVVIADLIRRLIIEIMKSGYVYLMTNIYNKVLYIGVTNNLLCRVAEHKARVTKGFT